MFSLRSCPTYGQWDLTMRRSTSVVVCTGLWERYPFLGELSENAERILLR